MPDRHNVQTLDRLHRVLTGSFLAYLGDARPYVGPTDVALARVLDAELATLAGLIERVALALHARGAETRPGEFSIDYTNANDVAIGYALRRAADGLRRDLERLDTLVADEEADRPFATEVVEAVRETRDGLLAVRDRLVDATRTDA